MSSKKLKGEQRRIYHSVCTRLRLKYPKAFVIWNCRPLKIGIDKELIAENPDMDPRLIKRFLCFYCRDKHYLNALTKRRKRIGLDGKSVETIAPEAKQFAIELLEEMECAI